MHRVIKASPGKYFEPLLCVLAAISILAAVMYEPRVQIHSTYEWIERELDILHYEQLKREQEARRNGR